MYTEVTFLMLQNNLNRLMSERNIKTSDISKDVGLAKTTISSLSRGTTTGIQFDTLEKICSYLQVTPAEFFDYSPYVLETTTKLKLSDLKNGQFQYSAHITNNVYSKEFKLDVKLLDPKSSTDFPRTDLDNYSLYLTIDLVKDSKYSPEELFGIIGSFPLILERKFYQQLVDPIIEQLNLCTKKKLSLPAYTTTDPNEIILIKNEHCIFDIFKNTPCHKLIDLKLGTDDLTL